MPLQLFFQRLFVQMPHRLQGFARNRFFERTHALIEIGSRFSGGLTLCVLPLMKGKAETIRLCSEARQPLFEAGIVLMHRRTLG